MKKTFFEQSVIEGVHRTPSCESNKESAPEIATQWDSLSERSLERTPADEKVTEQTVDATQYDDSFSHPMLKTNNRIFDPGYRNNLLTASQCDSSLVLTEKEVQKASINHQDSFAIGPIELDDSPGNEPEVQEIAQSKSKDSQQLADWETSKLNVDLEQVPAVPSSPSVHSTDESELFDQLNEV